MCPQWCSMIVSSKVFIPLCPGVVVPEMAQSMGQIEQNCVLMLK